MLDLKFIRENAEAVKANIAARFMNADVDEVLRLYEKRNALITETDDLRRRRNENAAAMKGKLAPEERAKLIEEGKSIKEAIAAKESEESEAKTALEAAAALIPNMAHPDAPVGKEDKDNTEIARSGEPAKFGFKPKDHTQIAENLDLIDFETGAKVSGSKFYFLKNEAVFLELALTRYALDILKKHGFTVTITPDIAREEIAEGIGFNPRGEESNHLLAGRHRHLPCGHRRNHPGRLLFRRNHQPGERSHSDGRALALLPPRSRGRGVSTPKVSTGFISSRKWKCSSIPRPKSPTIF